MFIFEYNVDAYIKKYIFVFKLYIRYRSKYNLICHCLLLQLCTIYIYILFLYYVFLMAQYDILQTMTAISMSQSNQKFNHLS